MLTIGNCHLFEICAIESELFTGINLNIKDTNDCIVGGIVGNTNTPHIAYIDHLWVDDAHRGALLGSRLLQAFENRARTLCCEQVCVDTFDYQAPAFYEKNNYQLYQTIFDELQRYKRLYYSKII